MSGAADTVELAGPDVASVTVPGTAPPCEPITNVGRGPQLTSGGVESILIVADDGTPFSLAVLRLAA
jgi:hypothetical protein